MRAATVALMVVATSACAPREAPSSTLAIPRTASGRPNLQGIWQVQNAAASDLLDHAARVGARAGRSVVEGNEIPYQPWAAAKQAEHAANRTADPLAACFMPGVPRIMYMPFPYQIYQTDAHVAITFEWSQVFRLIYTNGSKPHDGIEFWMGDSRGRWEGDTLVVDVTNHNDKTWFDMAGNFHSEALHLVERFTMRDTDTIQYDVTIEDPKVFTRPWKMSMPLHRYADTDQLLEYQCQAEAEEARGDFEPEPKTWYPGAAMAKSAIEAARATFQDAAPPTIPPPNADAAKGPIKRLPDGTPDLSGHFLPDGGGANYGLAKHEQDFLTPGGRGVVVDPPDGQLPMLSWAAAEQKSRVTPERGYDDPTAHCFVAGVPRSMYVPAPLHIVQTSTHAVFLHERMSWRSVALDGRPHLPDTIRLWQGDSRGRWDGSALVIETTNLNGKTWLNEVGEIVSHAERVVERITPVDGDTLHYQATVTDPLVYSRPWTIAFAMNRQQDDLLEVACHEDNEDLQHLKDVRDAARAKGRQR
jgi:hypothetical protein